MITCRNNIKYICIDLKEKQMDLKNIYINICYDRFLEKAIHLFARYCCERSEMLSAQYILLILIPGVLVNTNSILVLRILLIPSMGEIFYLFASFTSPIYPNVLLCRLVDLLICHNLLKGGKLHLLEHLFC